MTIKIFDCEQGSEDWLRIRMGKPTTSQFKAILAVPNDRGFPTRTRYLYNLASEIITGEPLQTYSNDDMARGNAMQPEAITAYEFLADADVKTVGFVENDSIIAGRAIGCSPDGLVGDDGLVEVKTESPHLLIDRLMGNNNSVDAHLAQVQGGMWVTNRAFCDVVIYWNKLPPFRRRIKRDELFIRKLETSLKIFCEDLDKTVEKIRRYGQ